MCDRSGLKFSDRLAFTCPAELRSAVKRAANTNMQTPSEYARRAIRAALIADGILKGN
jgi:hypothetical protein